MSIRITLCPTCGKQTGMYESGRSDGIAANKCECHPPTDPTPTPTPREVLAVAARKFYQDGWEGFERGKWELTEPSVLDALERDYLSALAATGDAPLSAKRLAELRGIFESSRSIVDERCGLELLGAYTTLAAQLAAVRAERDALREQVDAANSVDGVSPDDAPEWVCELPAATAWREGVEHGQDMVLDALATPARPTDTGGGDDRG